MPATSTCCSSTRATPRRACGWRRGWCGSWPAPRRPSRIYPIDATLRPEGRQGAVPQPGGLRGLPRPLGADLGAPGAHEGPAGGGRRRAGGAVPRPAGWGGVGPAVHRGARAGDPADEGPHRAQRIPGEDPEFHLKLGRGSLSDVEWTVQLLQLRGVRSPSTMGALEALVAAGALPGRTPRSSGTPTGSASGPGTAGGWSGPGRRRPDALPQRPPDLSHLAASLGTTARELREDYRR